MSEMDRPDRLAPPQPRVAAAPGPAADPGPVADARDPDSPRGPAYGKQPCLQCGYPISDIAGSKAAICPKCGFKDPCC